MTDIFEVSATSPTPVMFFAIIINIVGGRSRGASELSHFALLTINVYGCKPRIVFLTEYCSENSAISFVHLVEPIKNTPSPVKVVYIYRLGKTPLLILSSFDGTTR